MPQHKSASKRMRQDRVIRDRNAAVRSQMRTAIKKVRQTAEKEEAQKSLLSAVSIIDKTVSKGVIHKNTADRYKSRLTKLVNSLPSEKKTGAA